MKDIISLQCLSLKLSDSDILKMIPESVLSDIKNKDPHPFFQVYSICHEGTSTPTMIGKTSRPIHWMRTAIQSIKGKIKRGINFFLGHNKDNSTEGRETLGEIVADDQREIDGKLHHIVVGYFPDKKKVADLDICSQESNWNFFDAMGQTFADAVESITGIALASSKDSRPAFDDARRLGMVQAFDDSGDDHQNKNNQGDLKKMDLTTVNFAELLGELKRRNVQPVQVFTLDEIKGDKEFGKEFARLEKEQAEKDSKIKTLETEKAEKEKLLLSSTAKSRVETAIKDMKLTEKQKAFILARAEGIKDFTDAGIKTFIEDKVEDFKVSVKLGYIKDDLPDQKPDDNKDGDKTDYTKAANNPLLEEDL